MTAQNVLHHPPVRRNPLLADVLQAIGLVNRAGLGVARIYEELLLLGKDLPRHDADESHVRLVLPTRTHARFVRFVHEVYRGGGELGLDDLILLRRLTRRGSLDRWTAAEPLQSWKARRRPGSSRSASEATWLRGAAADGELPEPRDGHGRVARASAIAENTAPTNLSAVALVTDASAARCAVS